MKFQQKCKTLNQNISVTGETNNERNLIFCPFLGTYQLLKIVIFKKLPEEFPVHLYCIFTTELLLQNNLHLRHHLLPRKSYATGMLLKIIYGSFKLYFSSFLYLSDWQTCCPPWTTNYLIIFLIFPNVNVSVSSFKKYFLLFLSFIEKDIKWVRDNPFPDIFSSLILVVNYFHIFYSYCRLRKRHN